MSKRTQQEVAKRTTSRDHTQSPGSKPSVQSSTGHIRGFKGETEEQIRTAFAPLPDHSSPGETGKQGVSGAGSGFQRDEARGLNFETLLAGGRPSACSGRTCPLLGSPEPFNESTMALWRACLGHTVSGIRKDR